MGKSKVTGKILWSKIDVKVVNQGSVVALILNTHAARAWVQDNLQTEDYQWQGTNTLVLDHRYADTVIAMMEDQEGPGLLVRS